MNISPSPRRVLSALVSAAVLMAAIVAVHAQPVILWEAYNDYRPSDQTHPNATGYDLRIDGDGGPLKDFKTGADLKAAVEVATEGTAAPNDFGALAPPNAGSPADLFFKGKVDLGNSGLPGVQGSTQTKLILMFKGLDPAKRYNFRGTVSRGGGYNDRWSVFTITGADAYVNAHVDGSNNKNLITKASFPTATLSTNQVALNTGDNKAGSIIGWDNIEPGPDGQFEVSAEQYRGPTPFGNASAAPYGYGFNAIYLAEIQAAGTLRITENPANQLVPAGTAVTLRVVASGAASIAYQWQKAAPGSSTFADVAGATQASYTTPPLTVADSGSKYRCIVSGGAARLTSGEATVTVDGAAPTIASARGSINLNTIYVKFSEPMKVETLRNRANFAVSGGLNIVSASDLDPDPTTLRLRTSAQTPGTTYTVTINNVEDLAGNKVAANSTISIAAFTIQAGAAGLEIWRNLATGGALTSLRDSPRFPNEPDVDYATKSFDSEEVLPSNAADPGNLNTYGGRFRAWLTPEESGTYEFFIRADDNGEFRISKDDKFDGLDDPNTPATATSAGSGNPFQEPGIDGSVSEPVALEKGKRYAVHAIWKEGNGNDYLQIAMRKVGDPTPADQLKPIPSKLLSYYAPGAPVQSPAKINRIALQLGRVVIEWNTGTLQSSDDLVTWKDEPGAKSPFSVTPAGRKFYRLKN